MSNESYSRIINTQNYNQQWHIMHTHSHTHKLLELLGTDERKSGWWGKSTFVSSASCLRIESLCCDNFEWPHTNARVLIAGRHLPSVVSVRQARFLPKRCAIAMCHIPISLARATGDSWRVHFTCILLTVRTKAIKLPSVDTCQSTRPQPQSSRTRTRKRCKQFQSTNKRCLRSMCVCFVCEASVCVCLLPCLTVVAFTGVFGDSFCLHNGGLFPPIRWVSLSELNGFRQIYR